MQWPTLLLTSLGMNHLLSWVLSVHPGLTATHQQQPKPVTLGCCSSSLCWLMEVAPRTRSSPMGPARVCWAQHALISSPAAEVKAPALREPYGQGSKEGTEVKTRGFFVSGKRQAATSAGLQRWSRNSLAPEVQWPPAHDQTPGVSLLAWRSLAAFGSFQRERCGPPMPAAPVPAGEGTCRASTGSSCPSLRKLFLPF